MQQILLFKLFTVNYINFVCFKESKGRKLKV